MLFADILHKSLTVAKLLREKQNKKINSEKYNLYDTINIGCDHARTFLDTEFAIQHVQILRLTIRISEPTI